MWEFNFFHIFGIPSSSRHEKRCQILQSLFWVFQYSRNSQCSVNSTPLGKHFQYLIKKNSVNYNWSNSKSVEGLKYWMIVRGKASNKSQQSKWSNSNFTFLFAYSFALLSRAKCSCLWSSNHRVLRDEILSEGAFSIS